MKEDLEAMEAEADELEDARNRIGKETCALGPGSCPSQIGCKIQPDFCCFQGRFDRGPDGIGTSAVRCVVATVSLHWVASSLSVAQSADNK